MDRMEPKRDRNKFCSTTTTDRFPQLTPFYKINLNNIIPPTENVRMRQPALLLLLIATCSITPSTATRADEPAERFLEALRSHGYYDVALDYVDSIRDKETVSSDFRKNLPFQKAETLIASTTAIGDIKLRDARLDEAQQILAQYANSASALDTLARIAQQQGNLFYQRATISLALGASDRLTAAEREKYAASSRQLLEQARTHYSDAKAKIRELIDPKSPNRLKIDSEDPETEKALLYFQSVFVTLRLRLAMTIEQLADTYPENDPHQRQLLTEAAKEYRSHHEDYYGKKYIAAWQARLNEARCYQKLGNYKESLDTLEDIFSQGDGALVSLKQSAMLIAAENWSKLESYPAGEIVSRLEPVVDSLSRSEARNPNWLRIQLELAKALHLYGDEVRQQGNGRSRNEAENLKRQAAKHFRVVAKTPSPHRDQARAMMNELNIPLTESKTSEQEQPLQSFEEALLKAVDHRAEMEVMLSEIYAGRQKLASVPDNQKEEIEADLNAVSEQLSELTEATLEIIDVGLGMADGETRQDQINQLRNVQAYCYYANEQYLEAATIGEFLLTKFPGVDTTRQGMNVLVQSCVRIYSDADVDDREFEKDQLYRVCTEVVERWPSSREAGTAAQFLIGLALTDKQFDQADALFQKIPEDFQSRPLQAARLGTLLWADYRSRLAGGATAAELEPALKRARSYLEIAVAGSPDRLTWEVATASRYLVDVLLEEGNTAEAIHRLESAAIAPLDLIKQKHPVIVSHPSGEPFARDTYRTAMRVFLSALKDSKNPQTEIDRIRGILDAIRQSAEASNRPEDRQQLSQIYTLVAHQILTQFHSEPDERKLNFANHLVGFLNSIERDSNDPETILWAGSTALKVANSLTDLGMMDESRPLFQQAVTALNRAEELGFDTHPQKDRLLGELQRQRGLALRGSLKFEEAMEQFVKILGGLNQAANVQVQVDAAETLEAWGRASKQSAKFAEAIKGTAKRVNPQTKRESNVVWGWEALARAARGKQEDLFCEAILHWAECLLENGIIEKNKDRIALALKLIETEEDRVPSLGRPDWKLRFEKLKDRIRANQ